MTVASVEPVSPKGVSFTSSTSHTRFMTFEVTSRADDSVGWLSTLMMLLIAITREIRGIPREYTVVIWRTISAMVPSSPISRKYAGTVTGVRNVNIRGYAALAAMHTPMTRPAALLSRSPSSTAMVTAPPVPMRKAATCSR